MINWIMIALLGKALPKAVAGAPREPVCSHEKNHERDG
jgi:hypothetical protein